MPPNLPGLVGALPPAGTSLQSRIIKVRQVHCMLAGFRSNWKYAKMLQSVLLCNELLQPASTHMMQMTAGVFSKSSAVLNVQSQEMGTFNAHAQQ